jgi:hypothetical protein
MMPFLCIYLYLSFPWTKRDAIETTGAVYVLVMAVVCGGGPDVDDQAHDGASPKHRPISSLPITTRCISPALLLRRRASLRYDLHLTHILRDSPASHRGELLPWYIYICIISDIFLHFLSEIRGKNSCSHLGKLHPLRYRAEAPQLSRPKKWHGRAPSPDPRAGIRVSNRDSSGPPQSVLRDVRNALSAAASGHDRLFATNARFRSRHSGGFPPSAPTAALLLSQAYSATLKACGALVANVCSFGVWGFLSGRHLSKHPLYSNWAMIYSSSSL